METTKIFRKIGINKLLFTVAVIAAFSSCDTLESDQDFKTDPGVKNKEIHVLSNSTVVIDLNARIQTNEPVTLTVTSETQKGELVPLGGGLLSYSPQFGTKRDAFQYSVSNQGEIIKYDSVIIIIENDSTNLPCGLYLKDDLIYNFNNEDSISSTIDVLSNDIICGYDSLDLELSIYSPEPNFAPYYGTASVIDNRIVYTAGNNFQGVDKLIYKVSSKTNPSVVAFGFVYINIGYDGTCDFVLQHDNYGFVTDTLTQDTSIFLSVFDNDNLCDSLDVYQYSIISQPANGSATIDAYGINYTINWPLPAEIQADSITYEVCGNAICQQAFVKISIKK
jgi:hypothetical protein